MYLRMCVHMLVCVIGANTLHKKIQEIYFPFISLANKI